MFEANSSDDISHTIVVTKAEGDHIMIDINYFLTDVALNFDVTIVSVREATKQELDHGYCHEDGHSPEAFLSESLTCA